VLLAAGESWFVQGLAGSVPPKGLPITLWEWKRMTIHMPGWGARLTGRCFVPSVPLKAGVQRPLTVPRGDLDRCLKHGGSMGKGGWRTKLSPGHPCNRTHKTTQSGGLIAWWQEASAVASPLHPAMLLMLLVVPRSLCCHGIMAFVHHPRPCPGC